MEEQVKRLVEKAWKKYEETPKDKRLLIGIAGIPGSGKTTLSQTITNALQNRADKAHPSSRAPITVQSIPMDGYHYTRAQLDAFPNPSVAHARRGAAFTFDADAFLDLIITLRKPATAPILAPTFDHQRKDPVPADIHITESVRIVVVEGNYLALDEPLWRDACGLFDEVWFVDVAFDVARRRLRERHVRAGIVKDLEEGDRRAVENDLVNGQEILDKLLPVTERVQSLEDGGWVRA